MGERKTRYKKGGGEPFAGWGIGDEKKKNVSTSEGFQSRIGKNGLGAMKSTHQ